MDERSVRELLADFEHLDCIGSAEAVFSHITNHAGDCRPGSLYIALSGIHADGHQFIDEAVSLGAAVILHETPLSSINPHITYLRSSQVRTDMSHVSAWFYHTYDNPVHVIGITGTDGKTTTCYLLYQLLVLAGIRTALLSTVYADDGTGLKSNPQRLTTPEAPIIHEFLYEAHNNGVRYAVIEASSHALSHKTERLADIVFDTGLITTLSAEHLDFHGTKKEYFYDKMNLFRQLRSHNSAAVLPEKLLNRWTPHFAYHERVYSYSCKGNFRVGYTACIHTKDDRKSLNFNLPFAQSFFAYDAAAAAALFTVLEPSLIDSLHSYLPLVNLPEGRWVEFTCKERTCIIDYAHTSDAFNKLFFYVKRRYTKHRIISVFGAAGERDKGKRAPMGKTAAAHSTVLVITNEDPRSEDPFHICKDICKQLSYEEMGKAVWIEDRQEAVAYAVSASLPGDILLFLGKGHEKSILCSDGVHPWNETKAVEQAFNALKTDSAPIAQEGGRNR